jgi:hypothetical protein
MAVHSNTTYMDRMTELQPSNMNRQEDLRLSHSCTLCCTVSPQIHQPHRPSQDNDRPQPVPYFVSPIASYFHFFFSHVSSPRPLSVSDDPPPPPRALIRADSFNFSLHILFLPRQVEVRSLLLLAPWPSPDPDLLPPRVRHRFCLDWLVPSYLTDPSRAANSSPFRWRHKGHLNRW